MLDRGELEQILEKHIGVNDGGRYAPFVYGIPEAADAILALSPRTCEWQYTEKGWRPGCKPTTGIHVAGTLAEYGILYCSHCGGEIVEGESKC